MDLIEEQTKDLMPERNNIISEDSSLCSRFLRKKYKCIMLWMLSIIAFSQLIIIIFEKIIDEEVVKLLSRQINMIFSVSTNSSNLN